MEFYKGRTVVIGQKVDVYRNLHHGGYSIRDSKSKQVLAHADSLKLSGSIVFKVNEKGRQKTIEEKKKRVHAFVQGFFISANEEKPSDMKRVIVYDPYVTPLFKDVNSDSYLTGLEGEVFFEEKVIYTHEDSLIYSVHI